MAGVFTIVVLATGASLYLGLRAYLRFGRGRSWLANPYLPVLAAGLVLAGYLVAKIAYEEVYPCLAVDDRYCDFASTQYRNLFGWEF